MTLPAFSIARPIARGIAHPIAAHEGVGAPAGYAWLTDFEGNALYDFEGNRLYGAII